MAKLLEVNLQDKLFFGFDIAGSSQMSTGRLLATRARMFPGAARVLKSLGLKENREYQLREAGDGGVLIIDHVIDEGTLLTQVLLQMAAHLRENEADMFDAPLRMRYAMHIGSVCQDSHGYFGAGLSTTFRILDSEDLRIYLKNTNEEGVVAISPAFLGAAMSSKSSLNTPQQRLLYDWDELGIWNKEMTMDAHAAPLSSVRRLAGAATLQRRPSTA